jgi:surface-adhesin protein E
MTRLFLFILLFLSSGPAFADWMSLGESDSGTTVYADPTTMRREGDLVKMWVLFDFKKERNQGKRFIFVGKSAHGL